MALLDFRSSEFRKIIPALAEVNGWRVNQLKDDQAVLLFETAKHEQTLYITKLPNTLEFSVPSIASFARLDEIPTGLASLLLQRNTELKFGFWELDELEGRWIFSVTQCEELDRLDGDHFGKFVDALVEEADQFQDWATQK